MASYLSQSNARPSTPHRRHPDPAQGGPRPQPGLGQPSARRQPAVGQPSANRQRCMRLAYGWPATPALPALHIVRHPPQRAEAGPGVGGVGRVRGAELT